MIPEAIKYLKINLLLNLGLVEQITPLNLKNIRQILNSSAMDIMYYTSPIYGREIQNSLANELNRLHSEFVERHPHHHFKVSIMAHSLGSVISYDIITGWEPFVSDILCFLYTLCIFSHNEN